MLSINRTKTLRPELYRKSPGEADASELVTESFKLYHAGELRAVYLNGMGMEDLREAVLSVKKIGISRRQSGVPSQSKIFGFSPRMPVQQRDFCAPAALNREMPAVVTLLERYACRFTDVQREHFPERHAHSMALLDQVRPEWRIPKSTFTSGIINLDNPLQYHYDAGNFKGTWSVMAVFKSGVSGGHLVLPEYGLKVACADTSVFLFDGQSELHGVTPIIKTRDGGYRYSVVFYALEALCKCGTPPEELRRAQIQRTKVEMKRAGLIK